MEQPPAEKGPEQLVGEALTQVEQSVDTLLELLRQYPDAISDPNGILVSEEFQGKLRELASRTEGGWKG